MISKIAKIAKVTSMFSLILVVVSTSNLHAQALKFKQNSKPQAPHKRPIYLLFPIVLIEENNNRKTAIISRKSVLLIACTKW